MDLGKKNMSSADEKEGPGAKSTHIGGMAHTK